MTDDLEDLPDPDAFAFRRAGIQSTLPQAESRTAGWLFPVRSQKHAGAQRFEFADRNGHRCAAIFTGVGEIKQPALQIPESDLIPGGFELRVFKKGSQRLPDGFAVRADFKRIGILTHL